MQARFVSLRVTETWEMVEGRNLLAAPAGTPFASHEAAPHAVTPPPRKLKPAAARKPADS